MKIAYLLPPSGCLSGPANGVVKQSLIWSNGLASLGCKVHFLNSITSQGIKACSGFDIVHIFQHGYWLNDLLRALPKGPKYFFSPILDSVASPFFYGLLARLPINHRLLAFSPHLLRSFCEASTVSVRSDYEFRYISSVAPMSRIEKHHIGISIFDGPVLAPKHPIPKVFALLVANLNGNRKNAINLIYACAKISLPLVLVGTLSCDKSKMALGSAIKKAKADVYILGFLPEAELRYLYLNCSVFCLPSLVEGVGQVAMEALYYGSPLVLTSIGGTRDYFHNYGTFVNPHSVDSIANGISSALQRGRFDINTVRPFMEQFSPHAVASQLLKSYNIACA